MTEIISNNFSLSETLPLKKLALFLDFDGTLAGFRDDPERVYLTDSQYDLLRAVNKNLSGALALISGRDVRDLSKRAPKELWRLGNHGLFKAAPNTEPPSKLSEFPRDLQQAIWRDLAKIAGTRLEIKGPVIAVHHRANPAAKGDIAQAIRPLLKGYPEHVLQIGHNVIEVKPKGANKGEAIIEQMKHPVFAGRHPVMIGDDATDEDGFKACHRLGGFGIKMGDGQTSARYRLKSIPDIYTLLEKLL